MVWEPVEKASAMNELFRRGESFGIKGYEIDGMDLLSVYGNLKTICNKSKRESRTYFNRS